MDLDNALCLHAVKEIVLGHAFASEHAFPPNTLPYPANSQLPSNFRTQWTFPTLFSNGNNVEVGKGVKPRVSLAATRRSLLHAYRRQPHAWDGAG